MSRTVVCDCTLGRCDRCNHTGLLGGYVRLDSLPVGAVFESANGRAYRIVERVNGGVSVVSADGYRTLFAGCAGGLVPSVSPLVNALLMR